MDQKPLHLDVLIFGGGAAGLWLLDVLHRSGRRVLLLESGNLGEGQTISSQGIIHGGLKYALRGRPSKAARMIRDMPMRWRRCLAGEASPDLAGTTTRGEYCCLWALPGLRSRVGLLGARFGLRIKPQPMPADARPGPLKAWKGPVARLDEQVLEPQSLLTTLSDQHRPRCLKIDTHSGLEFDVASDGTVNLVRLLNPETSEPMDIHAQQLLFCAGKGNAGLRETIGLPGGSMQTRPLHMVMARGKLPVINGHCIRGMAPWLTITSTKDCADRDVWQIGGGLAEDCIDMSPEDTIRRAQNDLSTALPSLDQEGIEFTTYKADRAEASSVMGTRPDGPSIIVEGNTMTLWPTKLALVPMLADNVVSMLPDRSTTGQDETRLNDWPRPNVALPPWERDLAWTDVHSASPVST